MAPFDPRLLRLVPRARGPVALLAGIGVLTGLATIGTAWAVTALVVAVVRDQPLGAPTLAVGVTLATRAGLAAVGERVAARAGATVSTALREQLVEVWLTRPAEQRPAPGTALTLAAQGAASVEPYVARYLPTLVSAAVVPPMALVALVLTDWPSALVVVLTLPLLPLFAALIGMTTAEDTQRRWRALSDLSGHFLDVMSGLPTLVGYGRGERQVASIEQVSRRHRLATMQTLRLAFLSSAALELLATISVAIVAVLVGLRLTHGSIELSAGLLAILLAPEAYWPVRRVGTEYHSAADGAEALRDVVDQLEGGSATTATPALTTGGDVRARGLGYRYPGSERDVLRGLDLDAGRGLTVVTGPSGTGKTTLLELLAGLRTPTSGSVDALSSHLVTQRPFFAAPTVRGNLVLGSDASDAEAWAALRAVGMEGVVAALPDGLDTPVGDDGFGLSAGQRARLVLARALLSPAGVVLLDEPTAHLDDEATAAVHAAITVLAQERTVVAVTHRPELLALADHHVELSPLRPPAEVWQSVPQEGARETDAHTSAKGGALT
ncbi:thiol reductant ABC exporter subunit CydD [Janibacter sp. UYMM211]|uniref:thiol reductant ABC exporter subunit CydD n=1 Tax=Janibacter sp. UYMM211 TaxID=3156342 RepID=UPI0033922D39